MPEWHRPPRPTSCFDGLLRPRQTQAPSPVGRRTDPDQHHVRLAGPCRPRGPALLQQRIPRARRSSCPDAGSVPGSTATVYDGAGRTTDTLQLSKNTEKWRSTTTVWRRLGHRRAAAAAARRPRRCPTSGVVPPSSRQYPTRTTSGTPDDHDAIRTPRAATSRPSRMRRTTCGATSTTCSAARSPRTTRTPGPAA